MYQPQTLSRPSRRQWFLSLPLCIMMFLIICGEAWAQNWIPAPPPFAGAGEGWQKTTTTHYVLLAGDKDRPWLDPLLGKLEETYTLNLSLMGDNGPSPISLIVMPDKSPLESIPNLFKPWDPYKPGFFPAYATISPATVYFNSSHFRTHPDLWLQQVVQEVNHLFLWKLAGQVENTGFAWFQVGLGLYAAQVKFPGPPHWTRESLGKAVQKDRITERLSLLGLDIDVQDPLSPECATARIGSLSAVFALLDIHGETVVARLLKDTDPANPHTFKAKFEKTFEGSLYEINHLQWVKFWETKPAR